MTFPKSRGARRAPPQIPGPEPTPHTNGAVDDWMRLRRFLVLGTEHGSYHASEWTPTRASAQALERCIRADGARAVGEIVRISDAGRAPRTDPALYGLAMAAGLGDADTRRTALDALPRVARTASQLLQFAAFVDGFRGWGRSLRRAVGRWYTAQPVEALAHQAVAHRRHEGIAHRDLLRRAHPARRVSAGNPTLAVTPGHERLFDWIVRGGTCDGLGFRQGQAVAGDGGSQGSDHVVQGAGGSRVRRGGVGRPERQDQDLLPDGLGGSSRAGTVCARGIGLRDTVVDGERPARQAEPLLDDLDEVVVA